MNYIQIYLLLHNKLLHWKTNSLTLAVFHCARRYVKKSFFLVCVIGDIWDEAFAQFEESHNQF